MTQPRLELLGALIGSRLMAFLTETLDLPDQECYLCTDSTIIVVEILSNTDPLRWRHCSGKVNPTDMLTRGVPASNLTLSKVWWQSPQWLSRNPDFWPQRRETNDEVPDADAELRGKSTVLHSKTTVQEPLLVLTDYNKWLKAMRVTAWIVRFIKNLQGEGPRRDTGRNTFRKGATAKKKASFVAGRCLRSSLRIRGLHPFLDEDVVIRIETRLQIASATVSGATSGRQLFHGAPHTTHGPFSVASSLIQPAHGLVLHLTDLSETLKRSTPMAS
ncbi:hypothetical protein HPB47_007282 [Ixodes persulcatus]|uniref:Uncharacterized protein n=1 Tax=Ixodes persulcatus TaxID=34615 RepID=A0AC60P8E0_IXOPE|nr:hypothetical protein HPB47_007282 [Ixodes persulcatus]